MNGPLVVILITKVVDMFLGSFIEIGRITDIFL